MSELSIVFLVGSLIVISMGAYAMTLLFALRKQKQHQQKIRYAQANYAMESIHIIAQAMLRDECNLSEGTIRINGLLSYLSTPTLAHYMALNKLYLIIKDMPILAARKQLKKNERMRLDLTRESAEVELEDEIKADLRQLLSDLENGKYYVKHRVGFSVNSKI